MSQEKAVCPGRVYELITNPKKQVDAMVINRVKSGMPRLSEKKPNNY